MGGGACVLAYGIKVGGTRNDKMKPLGMGLLNGEVSWCMCISRRAVVYAFFNLGRLGRTSNDNLNPLDVGLLEGEVGACVIPMGRMVGPLRIAG